MGPITTSVQKSPGFRILGQIESLENLKDHSKKKTPKALLRDPWKRRGHLELILSWGHQPTGARVKTDKGV